MGGATAFAAGANSESFKTSVCLDGWLYPVDPVLFAKISTLPSLTLNAQKWQWQSNIDRLLEMNGSNPQKILLTFKDIVHQSFSDFSFLMPGYVGRKLGVQGELHPLYTGEAILEMTARYLQSVFQGDEVTVENLKELVERYAHIVYEGHTDPEGTKDAEVKIESATVGVEEQGTEEKDGVGAKTEVEV